MEMLKSKKNRHSESVIVSSLCGGFPSPRANVRCPAPYGRTTGLYPNLDYISRNNFDDMIGARSEELAKEALSRMDVHLDLIITMIRPLDGLQQLEWLKEFGDIYKRLEKRLEPVLVNQEQ